MQKEKVKQTIVDYMDDVVDGTLNYSVLSNYIDDKMLKELKQEAIKKGNKVISINKEKMILCKK